MSQESSSSTDRNQHSHLDSENARGRSQGSEQPVVRIRDLNHYFGQGPSRKQVLFDNTLDLMPGEITIMTGPSGSGKTTLLTLVGALRSVCEGSLQVMGRELSQLNPKELVEIRRGIGFIFQAHNLFESLTAYQNVKMSLQLEDYGKAEMRERATTMLEKLGLGQRIDYRPNALSGGQRQRVSIARALANAPRMLLADEPAAALDEKTGRDVVHLFEELVREKRCCILLVTHDNRILDSADRIINMVDGRIVSDISVKEPITICEFLSQSQVFAELSPATLTAISEKMWGKEVPAGEEVIRQGEEGDKFYLIRKGTVEVTVDGDEGSRILAQLGPGEIFGEQALLTDEPRNATVVAKEDLQLYVLGKADFKAAVDASPSLKEQLLKVFFQRQ